MKAIYYEEFQGPIQLANLDDPTPTEDQVIIQVKATGLCRSDWHGWMGHDEDIRLPHVPGHELAGEVMATGKGVTKWKSGDRVTVPFVSGCGHCHYCQSGNQQICDNQFQPGFTAWGSFAELVGIDYAEQNLIALPESMNFETAASLGCRFITAYRGVVHQGQIKPGQWVAIHGCGGVGLSAIMIAHAAGARVIAIDIKQNLAGLTKDLGAEFFINAKDSDDIVGEIKEITHGGVHQSMDALGSLQTCFNSVACLRKRGRHVQVGLMAGEDYLPPVPMHLVVANELEIVGSHGMQSHVYPEIFELIADRKLQPEKLIGDLISLGEAANRLPLMDQFAESGVTVINQF